MGRPTLGLGVLINVMSLASSRAGLVPLTKTCRTLYAEGVPYLLHFLVDLPNAKKARSFCAFMLNDHDKERRSKHLRRLKIGIHFEKEEEEEEDELELEAVVDNLAKILYHSEQLTHLTITNCGSFLEASAAARPALLRLPKLQYLDVGDMEEVTSELLQMMTVPLKGLALRWYTENDDEPDATQEEILQHFASSLTEFSLSWGFLDEIDDQYPRVHTLQLQPQIYTQILCVEPLLLAFPNVERLRLSVEDTNDPFDPEEIDDIRETNEHAYDDMSDAWSNLDFLSGNLSVLYNLAFEKHVRYLDIDQFYSGPNEPFSGILQIIKPVCLDVDVCLCSLGDFDSLNFRVPSLSHLVFGLSLEEEIMASKHWQVTLLNRLIRTLRGTSIKFLALYLLSNTGRSARPYTEETEEPAPISSRRLPSGASSDLTDEQFAGKIAQAVPSLSQIYLFRGTWPATFWSIRRGEEAGSKSVLLESLDESVGFEIIVKARETPRLLKV